MKQGLVWGLLVFLLLGASSSQAQQAPPPLKVVVTIGMLGDVAEHVGGDCVEVTALMGPGVDPHLYQASARDVYTLQKADLILYSGYTLEGQLGEVLERFGEIKPTLAVAPASIDRDALITVQGSYGIDPHLWMAADLWAQTIPTVAEALIEQRPSCEALIRRNAKDYAAQLEALHEWIEASIATIPDTQRILVTAHDAFNYYGRAYGIEVAGIQGISTATETGIADIREMADVVVERKVPAMFVESTINPRTVQAVVNAARQQGQPVSIGAQLYSDAMGEAGTAGGTYLGMLYFNTRHIVEALGGRLPALPDALNGWAQRWDIAIDQTHEDAPRPDDAKGAHS
ncbi:zinc ABC transporter substrate-binding protein [Halomonas sp. McH1-25]|uniref:metal ABC transporter solute-binding protein, Zn/Mn family n=1 Tax=unclassified Halomonas TaxID=2609666 RepID=UPI001EF6361C|nr:MULTISPECIES: zinc ABC transporter substrate-binding protein [unclassified Halomonas]MCG7599797.1 zinc ABC transporter substrate-binding protein [Halomonas sp. McH1-25]MCP1341692.1 zinc ABC transporter substrate-binding protein [Halomonas sp. FL8]MCP1359850.1 zinc ABC transporter substrate-binding protein [Halomonas sp. BBD45]